MLKNYVTVALRGLGNNKLYTSINIFGLAVGLASCILIMLYVRHELSYDAWMRDADRVYAVQTRFDVPGREPFESGQAPGPAKDALLKDFSEIDSAVRLTAMRSVVRRGADVFREPMALTDPSFFDVLDLELVSGDKETALNDVSSLLISESMARKYFGDAPAVGQIMPMTFDFYGLQRDYRVVGVFKDMPTNSHLNISILAPINPSDFGDSPWVLNSWTSTNTALYIKLKPGADAAAITRALPEFERRNIPNLSFGGQGFNTSDFITLSLMSLSDIHLYGKMGSPTLMKSPTDVGIVTAFAIVAGMILLIACINFTNLATAHASRRAREVALRKVLGARRGQLVAQFLCESVLLSTFAFGVALVLVHGALPVYNSVLQRDLSLGFLGGGLVSGMAALIVAVGLAAGLYPALYLSGFRPARILKANKSAAAEGSGRLRTALVVVQFAISIGLLVCTTVIYTQTVYARNLDPGFDRNGLLVVRVPSGEQHRAARVSLAAEAAKLEGVTAVSLSNDVPTDRGNSNNIFQIPGQPSPEPLLIASRTVDFDFFETYRIPLLAGRMLEESRGGDDYTGTDDEQVARGGNILLNHRALARLGIASPQEAIGRSFYIAVGSEQNSRQSLVTVVGVVGDVAYRSVREAMEPTYYARDERYFNSLTLRIEGVSGAAANAAMERLWRELQPAQPYRAEFMQTMIDAQYQEEEAAATMFAAFSTLAIAIGCLGLYGLALFAAERRTKEIGIRKVLGARVRDVVRLLVFDFSKPVLIANVIAWPVAWFLMRDWLNGFESRITLNPLIFATAGFLALLIAWITVGGHALRAARENPIRALRYE